MDLLGNFIHNNSHYLLISYRWSSPTNVVIFSIAVARGTQLIFFKAIDTSNMIKSGKNICYGVSEVVWTLEYEKLAVIVTDDPIDVMNGRSRIEERFANVLWQDTLLIDKVYGIHQYAEILKIVEIDCFS
ncbi:hypothetical protein HK098_006066, partial [Nowakowskiella sp. JEL0407]